MYSVLKSYGLNGLNGFAVAVEADVSGGLPAFSLVGLPDSAVRESGDRVRSAVKNLGYKWPDRHITVNLAPADIRKSGPVYDLPLLLAVLASSGQMEEPPADAAFLGELALDGSLRPVSGVLPMALAAAEEQLRLIHRHKTGALINAAIQMGGAAAQADEVQRKALEAYAYGIGLVFQVVDDVLDVTGTAEQLGKPIGSDSENGKTTFVTLFGIDGAMQLAEKLNDETCTALRDAFGEKSAFLEQLARTLLNRRS